MGKRVHLAPEPSFYETCSARQLQPELLSFVERNYELAVTLRLRSVAREHKRRTCTPPKPIPMPNRILFVPGKERLP
jgi:hypothetical protein